MCRIASGSRIEPRSRGLVTSALTLTNSFSVPILPSQKHNTWQASLDACGPNDNAHILTDVINWNICREGTRTCGAPGFSHLELWHANRGQSPHMPPYGGVREKDLLLIENSHLVASAIGLTFMAASLNETEALGFVGLHVSRKRQLL